MRGKYDASSVKQNFRRSKGTVKILGKKGKLTEILRGMGKLSPEERKTTGQMANKVRAEVEKMLEEKDA